MTVTPRHDQQIRTKHKGIEKLERAHKLYLDPTETNLGHKGRSVRVVGAAFFFVRFLSLKRIFHFLH